MISLKNIADRFKIWMNYTDNNCNEYIDESYIFQAKIEDKNINIYHVNSKQRIAIISPHLEFRMLDLTHSNETEEYNNFILKQYAFSLIYRIISTI
jgi:hypothetical protein